MTEISYDQLEKLKKWDTPTICNGLEAIDTKHAQSGFTTHHMVCSNPDFGSIVGFAKTATIRARTPSPLSKSDQENITQDYYRYMAEDPHPSVVIIEDLDSPAGFGAWWGEVHTTVHQGFGAVGVVTNGSIRDLDANPSNFMMLAGNIGPSHGHVHVVDMGRDVSIFSMNVRPGAIIHADRHGAVVIPHTAIQDLPVAIEALTEQESRVINVAKSDDFSLEKFFEARKNVSTMQR